MEHFGESRKNSISELRKRILMFFFPKNSSEFSLSDGMVYWYGTATIKHSCGTLLSFLLLFAKSALGQDSSLQIDLPDFRVMGMR